MIIKASERSGAKQLALHLSNLEDNDHVELHKVHGCMAQDIEGALTEMYAISQVTRCKNHMLSLSLSPPKDARPTIADFENAVGTIAKQLGLETQPYILVFHEKAGRRHAHVVFYHQPGIRRVELCLWRPQNDHSAAGSHHPSLLHN